MRYVRRDKFVFDKPTPEQISGEEWPVSCSRMELDGLLSAGLDVGLFQFARFHGLNYLCAEAGAKLGAAAAWNVAELGIPHGLTAFADAEWTDCPTTWIAKRRFWARAWAFLKAWGLSCDTGGTEPGIYNGFDGPPGRWWYRLPRFRAYYCSAMKGPRMVGDPQPRGYCAWQGWEHKDVFGTAIDTGQAHYDRKGDRFYVVTA
jgi:hypothetical protein